MTELHGEKVNTVVDGVAKKGCIPCIKYSSDRLYTEASDFSLGCIPHIGERGTPAGTPISRRPRLNWRRNGSLISTPPSATTSRRTCTTRRAHRFRLASTSRRRHPPRGRSGGLDVRSSNEWRSTSGKGHEGEGRPVATTGLRSRSFVQCNCRERTTPSAFQALGPLRRRTWPIIMMRTPAPWAVWTAVHHPCCPPSVNR